MKIGLFGDENHDNVQRFAIMIYRSYCFEAKISLWYIETIFGLKRLKKNFYLRFEVRKMSAISGVSVLFVEA